MSIYDRYIKEDLGPTTAGPGPMGVAGNEAVKLDLPIGGIKKYKSKNKTTLKKLKLQFPGFVSKDSSQEF